MNVGELREMIEDLSDDRELMVVHQQQYPLRETIMGIYDPDDPGAELECGSCESNRTRESIREMFEAGDDAWCCDNPEYSGFDEDGCESEDQPLYLVADGHPYNGSPYGPRIAWEQARTS
jgi:hypothetical protein